MINFVKKIQEQLETMCKTGKLFRVELTGDQIYELYLKSFAPGDDPVFRDPNSSYHNCNLCHNFLRRYGNIVAINPDNSITTLFSVKAEGEYTLPAHKMAQAIRESKVKEVFFETFDELNKLPYESCKKSNSVFRLGMAKSLKRYNKEEAEKFGVVKPNEIREFNHFHLDIPKQFVDVSGKSVESIMGDYRDAKSVFQRGMEEISVDTLILVKDLINQGSLLDGTTHLKKVEVMIPLAQEYSKLPVDQRDNWCWVKSYQMPYARFKNELIGVLCSELSQGKELNDACKAWNQRVDPANYMKATAPITKKQIEEAKKFVEENGYEDSFNRRPATIDDIKASEIKHINVGNGEIKKVSVFDGVKSTSTRHKRSEFDGVEEVHIDKFMKDILPTCTAVEVMLRNTHEGHMVTMTTAATDNSKPIFKWNNNYSWTFNGNLAGKSQIKEAVKSRGGKVDGVLRISLSFPDTADDYDLHVIEPNGNSINYINVRREQASSGVLDLDAQGVDGHQPPDKRVENVIYTDISRMPKGNYEVRVNNYSGKGLRTPFTLEIEADGDVTVLKLKGKHTKNLASAAMIIFDGKSFTVRNSDVMDVIDSKSISKEIYGLQTNEFHRVNLMCLSPNHWGENASGNKHYFFMLDGCKCPGSIRSFHNENLNSDLLQHRKVMEVLGANTMITPNGNQLSGLGFNATVRDELVVRVSGSHKRVLKIKF